MMGQLEATQINIYIYVRSLLVDNLKCNSDRCCLFVCFFHPHETASFIPHTRIHINLQRNIDDVDAKGERQYECFNFYF